MASKKGGLGRGLGTLLEDLGTKPISIFEEESKTKRAKSLANTGEKPVEKINSGKPVEKVKTVDNFEEGVIYINLDDIKPNSKQPRKVFKEEALLELAESIKAYGVIQPILVRPFKNGYELVAGERRWRAARKAGLKKIPAIVRDLSEKQNALVALLENMQREDLNIIEEAQGILALMNDFGLSQEEAANAVGKSRPYVANALRLLKLPDEIKDMLEEGLLSAGHAKAIAGISGKEAQISLAKKAIKEGWSVRKIETASTTKTKKKTNKKAKKDAEFLEVEERLSQNIGTKISINGSLVKGKIEIEYYSRAELDRLIEILEK